MVEALLLIADAYGLNLETQSNRLLTFRHEQARQLTHFRPWGDRAVFAHKAVSKYQNSRILVRLASETSAHCRNRLGAVHGRGLVCSCAHECYRAMLFRKPALAARRTKCRCKLT